MAKTLVEKEIQIPFIPVEKPAGYIKRNINITRLSLEQAENLAGILKALKAKKARLKSNRPVENISHAIRYILENLR